MKKPCLLPALLLTCLLPSCTTWHLGERVRDAHTVYTGVDYYTPVDGMAWHDLRKGRKEGEVFYLRAPEKTFRKRPHITQGLKRMPTPRYDTRATGRVLIVAIDETQQNWPTFDIVPEMPRGLTPKPHKPPHSPWVRELSAQTEYPSMAHKALYYTCEYVADPLLTLITIPLEAAATVVAIPLLVAGEQIQQQEPQETPPAPNQ